MQIQGVLGCVATAAIRVRAMDIALQLGEGAPATRPLCPLASCGVLLAVHVAMVRRATGVASGLHVGWGLVRHVHSCAVVHVLSRVGGGAHLEHTHTRRRVIRAGGGGRVLCVCVYVVAGSHNGLFLGLGPTDQ